MRLAAVLAAAALACGRTPPAPSPAAAAPSAEPPAPAAAWVTGVVALRREPTDAPRVQGPGGKPVNTFLATLHRGEQVTVLEPREDWAKVRLSDDQVGWLKRTALLEDPAATAATVLVPADVFDRPELIAASAKRKIEPGTLVLVVKQRPPFAEVNVSGAQSAWVLSERLAAGAEDVAVAKLVEKARWLVKNGKQDDALAVLALAREHFSGVALVDALARELGELPPVDAGVVVPASGEAPAPAGGAPAEASAR